MARGKDSVILYQSFFDATVGLKAAAKAELWDCIGDYLNGVSHKFKDRSAELAWGFIVRQLDADRQKYDERCRKNRENGNRGGRPLKNQSVKVDDSENRKKPNGFSENRKKPNGFFENPNDTDTDTDSDKRKKYLKKENQSVCESNDEPLPEGYTLDEVLNAAKDPSVCVTEADAIAFFDYYDAQGWEFGNGKGIANLHSALRRWKRGKRDGPARDSPTASAVPQGRPNRNAGTYNDPNGRSSNDPF